MPAMVALSPFLGDGFLVGKRHDGGLHFEREDEVFNSHHCPSGTYAEMTEKAMWMWCVNEMFER